MAKHGTLALRHDFLLRRKDARRPMCEEQVTLVKSPHSPRPAPSGLHLTLVDRARSRHGSRRGCAGAAAVGGHAEPTAAPVHPHTSGGGVQAAAGARVAAGMWMVSRHPTMWVPASGT